MPTISFVQCKGGAGKTTAAEAISYALALNQTPVEVLDMDANAYMAGWVGEHCKHMPNIKTILTAGSSVESNVVRVIDTEGRSIGHVYDIIYAMPEVDLFIIPCNPHVKAEINSATATANAVAEARPKAKVRILWNRVYVGARGGESAQAAQQDILSELAKKLKIRALKSAIPDSRAFHAFGTSGWQALRNEHQQIFHRLAFELFGIIF